ncbi:DoxX family protein [Daejeonella lutea]|uniref:Putative oxidoreductase n=1 Tax=Daejeonella lutea TaxID=572036 RepID=A0A1T5DQS0_9SPHI|nr:DoxX family protein [Daejeonella lutea]SKB74052.1 putative oxidoreductase [Daejeonella lutea]
MALFASLGKYRNTGLLIVRLGLGVMMMLHGYPKFLGGPDNWAAVGGSMKYLGITFAPEVWGLLAAAAETFGGFLLLIGLAFRPVCLILTFTMLVAAVTHLKTSSDYMDAAHAIELGFVFFGLAFIGPGRYSVDKK